MKKFYQLFLPLVLLALPWSAFAQNNCGSPVYVTNTDLPYKLSAISTCGTGIDYTNSDPGTCNNTNQNGEDYVIAVTPSATVCVDINSYLPSGSSVDIFVYNGCPDEGPPGDITECLERDTGGNPREALGITMQADSTYYIILSNSSTCGGVDSLTITESSSLYGDNCCNPHLLTPGDLPYSNPTWTTVGYADEYDNDDVGMLNGGCGGTTDCDYTADNDYLFQYTATGIECITITLAGGFPQLGADPGIYILSECPDNGSGVVLGWSNVSQTSPSSSPNGASENFGDTLTYTLPGAGVYYFLLGTRGTGVDITTPLTIVSNPAPSPGPNCADPIVIAPGSLPYSETGSSTLCYGTFYDSNDACGSNNLDAEERVYSFTPSVTQCYDMTLSNASNGATIFLFDGCPDAGGTSCLGLQEEVSNTAALLGHELTSGTTYYIMVASDPDDNSSVSYDFDIAASAAAGTGSTCCAPHVIGSMPYTHNSQTTCGDGDDYENKCSASFMDGEETIYEWTSTGNECLTLTIADGSVNLDADPSIFVLDGCPNSPDANCLGYATQTNGAGDQFGVSASVGLASAGTYYIVVSSDDGDLNCNTYDLSITSSAITNGAVCATPEVVTLVANAYTSGALTTCCYGNDYDQNDVCGSNYMDGDDFVFRYDGTVDDCIVAQIPDGIVDLGVDVALFLLTECPDDPAAVCLATATVTNTNSQNNGVTLGATLPATDDYFIVVSSQGANTCTPFELNVNRITGASSGRSCADPVSVTAFPFSEVATTTRCMGDNYNNSDPASCGSLYESGEDRVYEYVRVASTTECLSIDITNANSDFIGYQVYSGCPDVGGSTCIASTGGATSGNLSGTVIIPGAGTYYIVVDSWANPVNVDYDISITSNGAAQFNDEPCNATALTLGTTTFGDNSCSSNANEPATPGCFVAGEANTVWFSVVAPASGELSIKTFAGSLADTQIGLYSGACGPTLTLVDCDDDHTVCSQTLATSEIVATGLTPGNTYYIMVDGAGNLQGNFSLVAIDGTTSYPATSGQDCADINPIDACNSTMYVGDPGFSGPGNTCNFSGVGNCTTGELNSAWYAVNISTTGNFNFTCTPNDGSSASCGAETDYDFLVWRTAGTGTTTDCSTIATNAATGLMACNFSWLGVQGVSPGGTHAGAFGSGTCFDGSFEPTIAATAGDIYYICIQNWTGNSTGFQLDFSNSGGGVVNFVAPTSVVWTGFTDTDWTNVNNWGGCIAPDCGTDATVASGPTNQPVLTNTTPGTYAVRDLTINPGATLTLNANTQLELCGDLTNFGTINCDSTATWLIDSGAADQYLVGAMTGANALGNITVTKTGGTVYQSNNVEILGDFTTSNATSVWDNGGLYFTISGDFTNFSGSTTFAGTGTTGIFEMRSDKLQNFSPGPGAMGLNSIVINNNSNGGIVCSGDMRAGTSGTVQLNSGVLHFTGSRKLRVANTASGAVSTGNTSAFVDGTVRRVLDGTTGDFYFPVGDGNAVSFDPTSEGYNMVRLNMKAGYLVTELDVEFNKWGVGGVANPGTFTSANECLISDYDLSCADHGYWDITVNAGTNTANYDVETRSDVAGISNLGTDWTVVHDQGSGFILDGDCNPVSTNTGTELQVVRSNLTNFSQLGIAQTSSPLPIELLTFKGRNMGDYNELEWVTISEINNDYFIIERSADRESWTEIARVDGAGNSSERIIYNAYDEEPLRPINYYRLRQVDFDGSGKYSQIVTIKMPTNAMAGVQLVYPVPTRERLQVDVSNDFNTNYEISILDAEGRMVFTRNYNLAAGNETISISAVRQLAQGLYTLRVRNLEDGKQHVEKFTKL